jgi:hypothetical protein
MKITIGDYPNTPRDAIYPELLAWDVPGEQVTADILAEMVEAAL